MKRKVLLMGRAGSGKTSMRSIIFDNVVAGQTKNYINTKVTMEIETAQIRFLGDLQLDLWDCGGQESYMDQYLESQKEKVFRNVQTLIYIFDITSTAPTDMVYFVDILSALRAGSGTGETSGSNEAGPKLHVLIHKMDLIENNGGQPTYDAKAAEIRAKCAAAGWNDLSLYATSIFNESLYSAWSDIVSTLNPHVAELGAHLARFASLIHASEVVLFERTTMLVIGQSGHNSKDSATSEQSNTSVSEVSSNSQVMLRGSQTHKHTAEWPEDRFAKISQAIKIFRLACGRLRSEFETMQVKQQSYTLLFDSFTPKTYVLVISTHRELSDLARIKQAIAKAKPVFAELPGVSLAGR